MEKTLPAQRGNLLSAERIRKMPERIRKMPGREADYVEMFRYENAKQLMMLNVLLECY